VKIGDTPAEEDIQQLPKIELHIYDIKSIDAIMEALQNLKKSMESGMNYFMAA
jgi:hypothetical protein